MRDLRDDLAACFRPPGTVANMRVTFYFSLNRAGGLIGPPRTTLLGFTGPDEKKIELLRQFQSAFGKCLPVPLNGEMAANIPGEVYFLQYIVGPSGVDEQVLLRPFGSHGGINASVPSSMGAREPEAMPEPIGPQRPFRSITPFRPRPFRATLFRRRLALPFRGGRARFR